MKIRFDSDLTINIPFEILNSGNIQISTPQYAFLRKRLNSDLVKELSALKMVIFRLPNKSEIKILLDMMGGCGFSSLLFDKYLSLSTLITNDIDITCALLLSKLTLRGKGRRMHFNTDANKLTFSGFLEENKQEEGLTFIDFNTFSVKHFYDWLPLFRETSRFSDTLIITDSACYGFRFGDRNLKAYGVRSEEEYYYKLSSLLLLETGKLVNCVCKFGNAALVVASKNKTKNIDYVTSYPEIDLQILPEGGLFV